MLNARESFAGPSLMIKYCSVCNPIQCASQVVVGDAAEWQVDESTWKFSNSTVLDVSPVGNTRRILQVGYQSFSMLEAAFYSLPVFISVDCNN